MLRDSNVVVSQGFEINGISPINDKTVIETANQGTRIDIILNGTQFPDTFNVTCSEYDTCIIDCRNNVCFNMILDCQGKCYVKCLYSDTPICINPSNYGQYSLWQSSQTPSVFPTQYPTITTTSTNKMTTTSATTTSAATTSAIPTTTTLTTKRLTTRIAGETTGSNTDSSQNNGANNETDDDDDNDDDIVAIVIIVSVTLIIVVITLVFAGIKVVSLITQGSARIEIEEN